MKILVTGANGFIGSQMVKSLLAAGHEVVCCVRSRAQTQKHFPDCEVRDCDFNTDTHSEVWLPRLKDIDVVVNCVGILQSRGRDRIEAIHRDTPCALFKACVEAQVKKVIHISALGAAPDAPTAYGQTKYAADQCLLNSGLDGVILRPSLVYGMCAYGGSSLFRAMSGLPWMTPCVGDGQQPFQPIYRKDLARAVVNLISQPLSGVSVLNALGPTRVTMRELLLKFRKWMGLSRSWVLKMPVFLIRLSARFGDWLGGGGPMNTTSIKMLMASQSADPKPFAAAIGFNPRGLDQVLAEQPPSAQDIWHARLYFLRPLLRLSIAVVWLLSGILPLTVSKSMSIAVLAALGFGSVSAGLVLYGSAIINIILGVLTCLNWRIEWVGTIEAVLIVLYTLFATFLMGSLWFDPFGSLFKNIPLFVATLVMMAISRDR